MKKIELGTYYDKVKDCDIKCLFVDGKPFVWGVLPESLKKAKSAWEADPTLKIPIMIDVCTHFVRSFSKFVGKDLTIKEINEGIEKGCVDEHS